MPFRWLEIGANYANVCSHFETTILLRFLFFFFLCHDFYFLQILTGFLFKFLLSVVANFLKLLSTLSLCLPLSLLHARSHIFVKSANVAIVNWLRPATSGGSNALLFIQLFLSTNMKANLHNNFCQIFFCFFPVFPLLSSLCWKFKLKLFSF